MSFQAFKFVELQSVIQFASITLLYQVGTDMADNEVLYINLFIILPLSIFMSWTKPSDHLTKNIPTVSLFSASFLMSITLSMIFQIGFQIFVFKSADYFEDPKTFVECYPSSTNTGNRGHSERVPCTRDTALYLLNIFQYIIICICFGVRGTDSGFRQPFYMNKIFFFTLILIIFYNTYKLIYLDQWSKDFYELAEISNTYRVILLAMVVLNLVLSMFLEYFSTQVFTGWWHQKEIGGSEDTAAK